MTIPSRSRKPSRNWRSYTKATGRSTDIILNSHSSLGPSSLMRTPWKKNLLLSSARNTPLPSLETMNSLMLSWSRSFTPSIRDSKLLKPSITPVTRTPITRVQTINLDNRRFRITMDQEARSSQTSEPQMRKPYWSKNDSALSAANLAISPPTALIVDVILVVTASITAAVTVSQWHHRPFPYYSGVATQRCYLDEALGRLLGVSGEGSWASTRCVYLARLSVSLLGMWDATALLQLSRMNNEYMKGPYARLSSLRNSRRSMHPLYDIPVLHIANSYPSPLPLLPPTCHS